MQDLPSVPAGNEASVALLEKCLDVARQGKMTHVSVVMVEDTGGVSAVYSGDGSKEVQAFYGASLLCRSLMDNNEKRMRLASRTNFPANRVMFDLANMPVCFDFAASIIKAEMARVREGAPAPLSVAWSWGQDDGAITTMLNTPQRQRQFEGILRPLVRLIGAVEDLQRSDGRLMENPALKPVVDAARCGEAIPKFRAPPEVRAAVREFIETSGLHNPITITLREAEHTPHRNSNIPEWIKFAQWLESQGEEVIFLRDTAKAREPLDGAITCPAASENLLVRTALYQEAKANIFVSNGPCMLGIFGDKPFLIFIELQDDPNYPANTVDTWRQDSGITPPEQLPWCRPDQRIIWTRDTFEVIRDAWQELVTG